MRLRLALSTPDCELAIRAICEVDLMCRNSSQKMVELNIKQLTLAWVVLLSANWVGRAAQVPGIVSQADIDAQKAALQTGGSHKACQASQWRILQAQITLE